MSISTRASRFAGIAALVALSTTGTAYAADDDDDDDKKPETAEPEHAEHAGVEGETGKGERGEKKEAEEAAVMVGLDMVFGWGKVPFVVQNPAGSGPNPQTPTYSATDKTQSNVQSAIFSASAEIMEHFGVGVRVPLTFASFNPDGSASRSTSAVGNVELEAEYGIRLGKGLHLVPALGIALPTAPGTEIDPGLTNATNIDQSAYDRFSLAKAAAAARGYEDNALFEPQRFGIIPKIALEYRNHGLSVEPYIKVENLVATSSSLANSYVGEFVGALRVGYWIQRQFELAAKVWFNTGFAGGDEDKKTSAAVEPQVVLRFGPVRPYAGVILPFAGPPQENSFFGVRVGVAVAF